MQANLIGIADQLSRVIGDNRSYIQGLPARELAGRQLGEGLSALIEEVNEWGGVSVTWVEEGERFKLPDLVVNTMLQVAREALANVTKHAQASTATVLVRYGSDGITLKVTDDGQGFDPELPRGEEHLGLRDLRSRAEDAGGTFTIQSKSGAGTTLGVWIPAQR
jgi:signal transduction histidine kinase